MNLNFYLKTIDCIKSKRITKNSWQILKLSLDTDAISLKIFKNHARTFEIKKLNVDNISNIEKLKLIYKINELKEFHLSISHMKSFKYDIDINVDKSIVEYLDYAIDILEK